MRSGQVNRRVLIVDDQEVVRASLARVFVRHGWRVEAYGDGETALAAFLGRPGAFDAALVDNELPGISGSEVVRALRAATATGAGAGAAAGGIPVVRISSAPAAPDEARPGEQVDAHVCKPFDPRQVLRAVEEAIALRARGAAAGGAGRGQPAATLSPESVPLARIPLARVPVAVPAHGAATQAAASAHGGATASAASASVPAAQYSAAATGEAEAPEDADTPPSDPESATAAAPMAGRRVADFIEDRRTLSRAEFLRRHADAVLVIDPREGPREGAPAAGAGAGSGGREDSGSGERSQYETQPSLLASDLHRRVQRLADETEVHALRKRTVNYFVDRFTVGRAPNNDVVLRRTGVAPFHAWLRLQEDGAWVVAAAGDRTPTQVDYRPLEHGRPLAVHDGANLAFGAVAARFFAPEGFYDYLGTFLAVLA
ncbi:MAG TPA: response regulator, partial [Myxococcota bacterium]|nr:response regulator [Myxococcota bacterium]